MYILSFGDAVTVLSMFILSVTNMESTKAGVNE
jgi:hypothetical protein